MADVTVIPMMRANLPSAPMTEAATLLAVIQQAVASGADIANIERMYALYEKASERSAQSAFVAALMAAKVAMPRIIKTGVIEGNVKDERGIKTGKAKQSTFAKWEEVCAQIEPVLATHGLVLTFETEQPTLDRVTVTAVLDHRDGHSRKASMSLPIDTGGAKNNVQGWGSSVSYGKRYTAFAVLNLVGTDDNDADGATPKELITDAQIEEMKVLIEATDTELPAFCEYFKVEKFADMTAKDYERALVALKAKAAKNG